MIDDYKKYKPYVDFINDYSKAKNAASGSKYDANSNVECKNVCTLDGELHKGDEIGINRYRMIEKITEIYGEDLAKEYIRQLDSHEIYRHDETHPLYPYTYSSKEAVIVKIDGIYKLISFEDLYDLCNEKEFLLDEENEVFGKFPKNIEIRDKNNKFTKISRLIKKKRHRDLVIVKTKNGENLIVTDNHPMIIGEDKNDTISAELVSGKNQYRDNIELSKITNEDHVIKELPLSYDENYGLFAFKKVNNSIQYSLPSIKLDKKFGYFVGFFIAEGWYHKQNSSSKDSYDGLIIKQKNKDILVKISNYLFETTGIYSSIYENKDSKGFYNLFIRNIALVEFLRETLNISPTAQNKKLPSGILNYSKDFIIGVLSGLIDGDATCKEDGSVSLRLASRTCISQVATLLNSLGVNTSMTYFDNAAYTCPSSHTSENCYPAFGVTFWFSKDFEGICEKYIPEKESHKSLYRRNEWVSVESVKKIENIKYLEENDFIYDITTESNTFILNNIWVHNCVSVTLYPFILEGLETIGAPSKAPKNLNSFLGNFINLVFAVSSQFAGACLYKDQRILVRQDGKTNAITIKDFVSMFDPKEELPGYNGWFFNKQLPDFEVYENGKWVKIKTVFKHFYHDKIYKVSTKNKRSFLVSGEHKFKVLENGNFSDVETKELKVGSTLVNTNGELNFDLKNNEEYIKGQIIGLIAGDGNLTQKSGEIRISVNYNDKNILEFLKNNFKFIFGKDGVVREGHKCFSFNVCSKEIQNKISEYFPYGIRTNEKGLELSKNYSVEFLLGYLDGLLASDGKHGYTFSLSVTSERIIDNAIEIIKNIFGDDLNKRIFRSKKENKKDIFGTTIPLKYYKYFSLASAFERKRNSRLTGKGKQSEVSYVGPFYSSSSRSKKEFQRVSDLNRRNPLEYSTDVITAIESFDNDDDFVYEIETESHYYSVAGYLSHNCATPEFLSYMDYFIRKEYGDDYYTREDEVVDLSVRKRTIKKVITDAFEQVVYSLNEPAAARNFQSVFWNISYFDKPYFDAIFDGFVFPDGEEMKWESVSWLQKTFMKWFNKERSRNYLTFPVETVNLVYDKKTKEYLDKDWADFAAEMWSEGHSFFCYNSDSADSLSSCCRLKNGITDNVFSFTLGAGGISTGSKAVITTNINRLVQNAVRDGADISERVREQAKKNQKYLTAFNEILKDELNARLLPVYDAGYISLEKQYLTQGINGFVEGAEFLGIDISPNEEYFKYGEMILKPIYEENKKARTSELMFNTEFVPSL